MISILDAIRSRVFPALLTAAGVVLITAGLFSYVDPTEAGLQPVESEVAGTLEPSTPSGTLAPVVTPGNGSASPSSSPPRLPTHRQRAQRRRRSSRIRQRSQGAPWPHESSSRCSRSTSRSSRATTGTRTATSRCISIRATATMPRKTHSGSPARAGPRTSTATRGMGCSVPIYELAIVKKNAKKMLGMVVQIYTSDFKLYLYEVREYRLHVTDLDGPLGAAREELWLQTSEGPKGTPGKTQLIAYPISVSDANPRDAVPKAKPVNCG